MVKYRIEYRDIDNNEFTCEIENNNYTGEIILLDGKCTLKTVPTKDHFEALRGRSLAISVLATSEQPLKDLWQDDEYYWFVTFKKGAQIKFKGYMSSEGVFQDFNADRWILNLEAVGPIAVVESVAYATEAGNQFVGLGSLIEVISNAINRGFSSSSHRMQFNTFMPFTWDGIGTENKFEYPHIDQKIFLRDDGETIQSCSEVLKDVLSSIGCVMFQENGEWYILPLNVVSRADQFATEIYDINGAYVSDSLIGGFSSQIGSQGETSIFHCSENQFESMARSVDTFVIRHDFEYGDQLMPNGDIDVVGNSLAEWTINPDTSIVNVSDSLGVQIDGVEQVLAARYDLSISDFGIYNQGVPVKINESFDLGIDLIHVNIPVYNWIRIMLISDIGLPNYQFLNGAWADFPSATGALFLSTDSEGFVSYNLELPPIPIDGDLIVEIRQPIYHPDDYTALSRITVSRIHLTSKKGILAGSEFRFKKSAPKKEKVKEPDSVRFSTSDNLSLTNVFYKANGENILNVNFAGNSDVSTGFYVAHERALMSQKKTFLFQGSLYGELPYLGRFEYLGVKEKMILLEHEYDTRENITTVIVRELDGSQPLDGVITEDIVFSQTVRPTIVG